METVRAYRNPAGHLISLYAGAFEKYGYRIPHPPELCYGGMGWHIVNTEPLVLPSGGGATVLTRFETLQHGSQEVHLLYWYQIKDMTFYDGDGQRRAVWKPARPEDVAADGQGDAPDLCRRCGPGEGSLEESGRSRKSMGRPDPLSLDVTCKLADPEAGDHEPPLAGNHSPRPHDHPNRSSPRDGSLPEPILLAGR